MIVDVHARTRTVRHRHVEPRRSRGGRDQAGIRHVALRPTAHRRATRPGGLGTRGRPAETPGLRAARPVSSGTASEAVIGAIIDRDAFAWESERS